MDIPKDNRIYAGGGILWREDTGEAVFAVVHRPKYDDWSLPKGKVNKGEDKSLEETALREVKEETGWDATLVEYVGESIYMLKDRKKVVHYWNMRAGEISGEPDPGEVDKLRWIAPSDALLLLTYHHDREIVKAAIKSYSKKR